MVIDNLQVDGISGSWDKTWHDLQVSEASFADFDSSVQVEYQNRLFAPYEGKRVLEVGSGSGYFSLQMAKAGAEVTLLDISPKALSVCAHIFQSSGVPCRMAQANGLQLPFRSECFDLVWNGGVIEHFYDEGKIQLLSEMRRVTKPGGTVFVSCPNKWDLPFTIAKKIGDRRGDWAFGYEELISPPCLKNFFHRADMANPKLFSFDPITGWWFLRGGKRIMRALKLDNKLLHAFKTPFGHAIYATWQKPLPAP